MRRGLPNVESLPIRGSCPVRRPRRLPSRHRPRVEGVLEAVAQEVEGDHGDEGPHKYPPYLSPF
jgi:hypothetical protein